VIRNLTLLAAAAIASACPAHAESQTAEQRAVALSTEQAAVWQGEVDYWDRVNSRDLEGYLDLWHPDFTGWPCGAAGPADLSGLAEFAEAWFEGMTARGQRTVPTAEAVIVKNGFAVTYLSAVTTWTEAGGGPASKREKFVHTWQATDDGWKIVGGMCAPLVSYDAAETSDSVAIGAAETAKGLTTEYSLFPSDGSLTHAEDGVALPDGRLLVGDWDHGLVTLAPDGTRRPFGNFVAAGFRTKAEPLWNSPNGVSFEPDGRHVLVADITGGHIYRVDTQTEQVTLIYDHPFGVNSVVRDTSGAIWFTQSTRNKAGEGSEARMFAAADKPLGDGSVWRIAPEELDRAKPVAVEMVSGLDFANGIAFDATRQKLYVAEILQSRILSFAVDPDTGALGDRRILATLPTPDNIELGADGMLWVASPFANAVYRVDPGTGDRQTIFSPTPDTNAQIIAETARRLEAGEPVLSLLTPAMWGPLPGLVTGVILAPDGTVYVSNLGDALVRLKPGTGPVSATSNDGGNHD
jgi:sugar lactone lactonase YvrE/ketosteroid isomerase-like protein